MKKLPLIILLLAAANTYADGIDNPIDHQDPNYWSGFDKNPCAYNLGYNEAHCVNPNSRIVHVPDGDLDYHVPQTKSVPEPAPMLLIGVALSALALLKKRAVQK